MRAPPVMTGSTTSNRPSASLMCVYVCVSMCVCMRVCVCECMLYYCLE